MSSPKNRSKSETKEHKTLADHILGTTSYKTTIKDNEDKVTAYGSTSEKADKLASKRWKEKKDK